MPRQLVGRSGLAVALGAALIGPGCGSEVREVAPEARLHATQNFSSSELNAPLGAKAKSKGAQVAPPPVR